VAPSAIAADERSPVPRALERAEIAAVAQAFGKAAARAHTAGFDVVEIHGAHGFLIHEFLSPAANQRTDDYGGSERNRMRFAIEVVEAVRAHWPQDKPLFLRLSAEDDAGWGPEQSIALAKEVKPLGVDVIDCSSGGILGKAPSVAPAYDYQVPYAERIRREAGVLTMAVGLIVHAQQAERILQDGRADLIALAREMLYNPNWAMDAAQNGRRPKSDVAPPSSTGCRRAAAVPAWCRPPTVGRPAGLTLARDRHGRGSSGSPGGPPGSRRACSRGRSMLKLLASKLPEVLRAIAPLIATVCVMQLTFVHAPLAQFLQFLAGAALAAIGMLLLFAGIEHGILPMGRFIGAELPRKGSILLIAGVAAALGFVTTVAEPDVLILAGQVAAASDDSIPAPSGLPDRRRRRFFAARRCCASSSASP
jgi:hypothetical protein